MLPLTPLGRFLPALGPGSLPGLPFLPETHMRAENLDEFRRQLNTLIAERSARISDNDVVKALEDTAADLAKATGPAPRQASSGLSSAPAKG